MSVKKLTTEDVENFKFQVETNKNFIDLSDFVDEIGGKKKKDKVMEEPEGVFLLKYDVEFRCIKCRMKTKNKDSRFEKRGPKYFVKSKCAVCNTSKSSLISKELYLEKKKIYDENRNEKKHVKSNNK